MNQTLTDKIEKRNKPRNGAKFQGFLQREKVYKFTNARKDCEKYLGKRKCGDKACTKKTMYIFQQRAVFQRYRL